MADSTMMQLVLEQPLAYRADLLLSDVRPLRACFETLALDVRTALQQHGVTAPMLTATLDLRYVGDPKALAIPFPLEIEDAGVCLADPLPLDRQALQQALTTFRTAAGGRTGAGALEAPIEVVMLRVQGISAA